MQTSYAAVGGTDSLMALAHAWHERVLAAYWAEALGGPTLYSNAYGDESSVVKLHSGNGPHEEMDRRAVFCFDQTTEDVDLASDGRLRQVLHDYFAWATTTTMSRYHESVADVPAGSPRRPLRRRPVRLACSGSVGAGLSAPRVARRPRWPRLRRLRGDDLRPSRSKPDHGGPG